MPTFYEQVLEALEAEERFALGTVVHTQGSTPQKKGARAIFFPDGRIVGTLGGGCLEAEARRRALLSLSGGKPFHFTVQLDGDSGWDDGLICGGSATLLIEPDARRHRSLYEGIVRAVKDGGRAALATVIEGDGALPGDSQLIRPLVEPSGDELPSSLAQGIRQQAQAYLAAPWREPKAVRLEDAGRVYLEPYYPHPRLLIVGAGHIGHALARICARLDFDVAVLDDRASLVNAERFPEAKQLLVEEVEAGIAAFAPGPDSYVVIVTRGHQHDAHALREVVASPAAYIGMIGSRRKVHVIFRSLLEERLATPEQLRRVRTPIGLDIGAFSVEEIAVSIAAELVAVRSKVRSGIDPLALFPEEEFYRPLSAMRSAKSLTFSDSG